MTEVDARRRDRRTGWAVFLITLGVWLLAASRERPWGDAEVMFRVAEAIVERGWFDIEYLWPPMSHRGADGRVYAQYALLPSLAHLPGALLLEGAGPRHRSLLWPVAAQLGPSLAAAGACGLWYRLARDLEIRRGFSLAGAFALAFATMLAVYARRPFSEALQVLTFVGFTLALLRFSRAPDRRRAVLVGVTAGLLVNAKLVFALAVVCGLGIVAVRDRATWRQVPWVLAGGLPFAALLLAYNAARWGSPFETGYDATLALAGESLFWGVFGLLLSPGKSVLLYNPLLLLAPVAWWVFVRERPRDAWLLTGLVAPTMLYYGRFLNWGGGWCWGPRYWIFAVPILLLPIVWWLDRRARQARPGLTLALAAALTFAGFAVNALGNAYYWDHYIRIARRAQMKWLGEPDRSGAVIDEAGRGHCDSCIEDTYALLWLPQFSPVVGHAWLLRHAALGGDEPDWDTARRSAPWHRHTSVDFELDKVYGRAKLDWWPAMWEEGDRAIGWLAVLMFALPLGAGSFILVRQRRR